MSARVILRETRAEYTLRAESFAGTATITLKSGLSGARVAMQGQDILLETEGIMTWR